MQAKALISRVVPEMRLRVLSSATAKVIDNPGTWSKINICHVQESRHVQTK